MSALVTYSKHQVAILDEKYLDGTQYDASRFALTPIFGTRHLNPIGHEPLPQSLVSRILAPRMKGGARCALSTAINAGRDLTIRVGIDSVASMSLGKGSDYRIELEASFLFTIEASLQAPPYLTRAQLEERIDENWWWISARH